MDDAQPIRRGDAREDRRFDQTQLRAAKYGERVHRDYAAHFFKWGFATRHIGPTDRVLEVGCGGDLPLVNVLRMGGRYNPASYLGCDLNNVAAYRPAWATVKDHFNFVDDYLQLATEDAYTLGVCIEVIEHMDVEDGRKLLAGFRTLLTDDGKLILSTPVFNGRAAKNHIHEYTVPELQQLIEEAGFTVLERYGTFASYRDIVKVATPAHREVLDGIRQLYSEEVTACFLAPLYPDESRNNVWVLTPRG
jgi:2-polyprenyl-3-methyl-5-hydroxy-6-metoxy-1,4-benzoquinol methylase